MGERLLILACSGKKDKTQSKIPAVDRYRPGAYYQILHQIAKEDRPDLVILSARFGFISGETMVPDYDQRLDRTTTETLLANPQTEKSLRDLVSDNHVEIFVAAGKDYRKVINHFRSRAVFSPAATIHYAQGGIGQQRSQLKAWLNTKGPGHETFSCKTRR